jgi:hypothetical protein
MPVGGPLAPPTGGPRSFDHRAELAILDGRALRLWGLISPRVHGLTLSGEADGCSASTVSHYVPQPVISGARLKPPSAP